MRFFWGAAYTDIEVKAMIVHGHLRYLTQFDKMDWYWRNLLLDYPDHPVIGNEAMTVPLTLYGTFFGIMQLFVSLSYDS